MKKIHLFVLSFLSGLLLSISWPSRGFPLLLFISFVPLFFIVDSAQSSVHTKRKSNLKVFLYSYISFLIWNILTTWWIVNSTIVGAILAISLNSMFMAIVFLLFHFTKKIAGNVIGYISLPVYWIAFEYLHLNWELSWTWLNLGNGFANYPNLIQWYEYTGTLGGTLWIFGVNIFLYQLVQSLKFKVQSSKFRVFLIILVLLVLIPILISYDMYWRYTEKGKEIEIVVVQPNIDPYNEKFGGLSLEMQMERMLKLADEYTDRNTNLLVFPETAISQDVCENRLNDEPGIIALENYIYQKPNIKILAGMSSYKVYGDNEKKSVTARQFKDAQNWYDIYNSAIFIYLSDSSIHFPASSIQLQIYHKSKLVPGVERIPYPRIFKPFEKYALDLGGTTGSLGTQDDRTPFRCTDVIIAPAICYESIFGEFMSRYVLNGANLLCIITNDGWWGNTPGYKQHFQYARLRAIETRRSIARSANTGISGFINQRGDILVSTQWWKPLAIKYDLKLNNDITFYVRFGDYIGRLCVIITLILLAFTLFIKIKLIKNKNPLNQ